MTFSAMLRRRDLDRRDLGARVLVADGVHQPRGLQRQQPRPSRSRCATRRSSPGCCARVGDRLAERLALRRAPAHQLERPLGRADRAHAVVDAARAEAGLGDHEAVALAGEEVRRPARARPRSAPRRGPPGRVAEDRQVAHDGHARACRAGTSDHRLLLVARAVGVGLAHHDEDPAALAQRARRPPLAAVEDVLVAVALDAQLDVAWRPSWRRRARSSRRPSGSRRRAAGAASAPAARRVPNCVEDLHVARVGRGAVAAPRARCGLRPMISASGAYSTFVRPGPALGVGVEEVPQPARARLLLELLHDRRVGVRVAGLARAARA